MASYDVCIVGGGLLGTATAYYAARSGLSVLLLEERDLASGASGAAFGGVSVGIYSYASARVPAPYVQLSKASLALYADLQGELGAPLDFRAPGSLDPFESEAEHDSRRDRAESLQECGVNCHLLDPGEVRDLEPALAGPIAGATYCPADGHVTPLCVVQALARGAREHGAQVRTGVRVDAMVRRGDRIVGVRTREGEISAAMVVNTAGIGAPALALSADVEVPLTVSRGQMFVTEPVPRLFNTYIHNIKQTASGTIVFGATREPGLVDTSTTVSGTSEVIRWAMRLVPALADIQVLRSWSGIRPVPPDGYPIIGAVPGVEGLLLAVMHRGVTLAPIIGRCLVELITDGRSALDLSPYAVERFAPASASVAAEPRESFYGG